ncbi:MAG: Tm-1-like ATP-binding domain-containing protein [Paracoccaceae bacterium]
MGVLLMTTYDSKREEAEYLSRALLALGIECTPVDISLNACGSHWPPGEKIAGMARAARRAIDQIAALPRRGRSMVVAVGGGTGGQIALEVLKSLPVDMVKVMVTTLPFDPRYVIADQAIVLVPTLADLSGLNATTRAALDRAAAVTSGLHDATLPTGPASQAPSVGVTALGATAPGVDALLGLLRAVGREATVFHANGFGGAAFTRWAGLGAFDAVIDYTPHELTRLNVAGVHADMPGRFDGYPHLPRVVLPGGVNFVGMGETGLMRHEYVKRAHYSHSPLFTHVKVSPREMAHCAAVLGRALARSTAPFRAIVPMGGFSSEDRPGGAVEDAGLRTVFADTLARHVPVARIDAHINDPACARAAFDALMEVAPGTRPPLPPATPETQRTTA